jgi:hypothetical protein
MDYFADIQKRWGVSLQSVSDTVIIWLLRANPVALDMECAF